MALFCANKATAQGQYKVISGIVQRGSDGLPVANALVRLDGRSAQTGLDGRFVFRDVPTGDARLVVTRQGFASRTIALSVGARSDTTRVFVRLASSSVQLEKVVVTAQEDRVSRQGGSVSRIERDAIEHLQASSLADILQLVPGQAAVNPTLAGPRQSLLRQAPTSSSRDPGPGTEAERANALGTSIVLDGVPVSNNANLQTTLTILNSGPNSLPQFASTAGRGLDLRQISADNIESVEVIRGIPSARHGDLTAGAVLVTSRAGAQRPELRVRANPLALEVSSVAGWGAGAQRGLSLDANLVQSQDDARSPLDRFTRATVQLAWSARPAERLAATLRVRGYSVLDESKRDPDDLRYQRVTLARDRGGRADLRLHWGTPNARGWHTEFISSISLAEQVGQYQELITRDIFPLSAARRDTIAPGVYGRSEYLTRLTVDGQPLNSYSRLETRGDWSRSGWRHEPLMGVELRYDANRGNGREFNATEPPRQNYGVGDRPDDFSTVRAVSQLAPYVEYRGRTLLRGRPLDLRVGSRLDLIDPTLDGGARHGARLAPRANIDWRVTRALGLRAGYGVTSKAPTLSQLYPLPRYFDLISYNYYAQNPAERLVVFTTRVVNPRTDGLTSAFQEKFDVAADWSLGSTNGTITWFDERTNGAFGTTRVPLGMLVPQFRAQSFPTGAPPVLEVAPFRVDSFVALYDAPRNTRAIRTRGVEFTGESPEWRRLRTQLSVSGGWFQTMATDNDLDIPVEQFLGGTTQPARVGVYESGRGVESSRLISSFRLVHRAPAFGLAASMLVQVTWFDDDRPIGRQDGLPVGVIDRSGRITSLTREQAASPAYANLQRTVLPLAIRWERRPPLSLINIRLTKTLPARTQLSLFANNALANRPLYQRTRTAGFEQRNQAQFFGIELLTALDFSSPSPVKP